MKGKFVNICMALLNLLLGIVIIIYSLKVPSEIADLTVQEYQIIKVADILIYIVFEVTNFLNFIHVFLDFRNASRKTGYIIALFSVGFIFVHYIVIAIFSILAAIIILISTIRIRWVEPNSYTAISIIVILAVIACAIIATCFIYKSLGRYILDKENQDEIAYKDTYFKYIVELDEDNDIYINVKKENKYGYINSKGEVVIGFDYDYASPFVPITVYDKNFDIALVCQDGRSMIILKNLRIVMTYQSESMDGDYEAKIAELEDFYYNTLGQTEKMTFEVDTSVAYDNRTKIAKYDEVAESYTYRYNLNDEYDLLITQSSMGLGDTYELATKDDLSIRIQLDCDYLDYDENYVYILNNGTIPFYENVSNGSKRKQGWFTGYGRKVTLTGNAQILGCYGDYTLIKNHNDDTIYFIDSEGETVSDVYKEIYMYTDDIFIVKNSSNKYIVINSAFEKVFENEWDYVDTSLLSYGLYIFGTIDGVVEFSDFYYAENLTIEVLNSDGTVLANNLQQIYGTTYQISNDKQTTYSDRYSNFLDEIKSMNITYVGDQYYE